MLPNAAALYPWIVAAAFVVGTVVFYRLARLEHVSAARLLALQASLGLLAHVGGRSYLLVEFGQPWGWRDLLLETGYRHPGAIGAVVLGLLTLPRILLPGVSTGLLADCAAPAIAFAAAVMRIGCFVLGCCAGTVSHLPWAIQFPPESNVSRLHAGLRLIDSSALPSLHVHPLQLYFLALSLFIGAFLCRFRRRKTFDGQVFLVFLVAHESGKAVLETFRESVLPHGGGASVPAMSIAFAVVAGLLLLGRRLFPRRHETGRMPGVAESG